MYALVFQWLIGRLKCFLTADDGRCLSVMKRRRKEMRQIPKKQVGRAQWRGEASVYSPSVGRANAKSLLQQALFIFTHNNLNS